MSIYYAQAEAVVLGAFTLILGLAGGYMGIGHADLRQVVKAMKPEEEDVQPEVPVEPSQQTVVINGPTNNTEPT